jgi:hypothetical protein
MDWCHGFEGCMAYPANLYSMFLTQLAGEMSGRRSGVVFEDTIWPNLKSMGMRHE